MRILFLAESLFPHGSGGETATYLYSKLLSAAGHQVTIVTNRFQGEESFSKQGTLQIYRLPLFKRNQTDKYSLLSNFNVVLSGFFKKLLNWADIVYVPGFWYSAILLAKYHHKPVVTHLHGFIPICPLAANFNYSKQKNCIFETRSCTRCIYTFERCSGKNLEQSFDSLILNKTIAPCFGQVAKLSDALITVSNAQRNIIVKRIPSLTKKIKTIYNPLPKLPYVESCGDDFGYFGGPTILKGFDTICQALTLYKERENNKILKIHATGFNGINSEHAKRLEHKGIITYGRVDQTGLERIYSQIRAVLVPSAFFETFGYVACEAFLRGRIVVASTAGGLPEVTEGCPGVFTIEAGDYRQLASQLTAIQSLSREKAVDLGEQNRAIITKKFADSTILTQITNLFAGLVD